MKDTVEKKKSATNVAVGHVLNDTVQRYGAASAEFLKGLRGVDLETGQTFDRSLRDISRYKINPDYVDRNIKQQAGFSAEVASVSLKNAEHRINGSKVTSSRSEDVSSYGKNHSVVDLVDLIDGKPAAGSLSQMKFQNPNGFKDTLRKIAKGEDGGKNDLSRYLSVDRLDIPTEQVEEMKAYCLTEGQSLRKQAEAVKANGQIELAEKRNRQADNFELLEKKISDSGLTTEEAISYRLAPDKMTAKDIAKVSHRAGIEGAKFGAALGGSVSLITNVLAIRSGNKELSDAALDTIKDTGLSAGVGYMTGFSGSTLKGFMQQSSSSYARTLSKTALPALVVSICIECSKSIHSYANGDIDEAVLLENLGGLASGMVSSSMFAAIGQVAIPVPVLGGLIGGMVGYTLSNVFYQEFHQSMKAAKLSKQHLAMIEEKCFAAKMLAIAYQNSLSVVFDKKITQLIAESESLHQALAFENIAPDDFCTAINQFASSFNQQLLFNNMDEFNDFMSSDQPLKL